MVLNGRLSLPSPFCYILIHYNFNYSCQPRQTTLSIWSTRSSKRCTDYSYYPTIPTVSSVIVREFHPFLHVRDNYFFVLIFGQGVPLDFGILQIFAVPCSSRSVDQNPKIQWVALLYILNTLRILLFARVLSRHVCLPSTSGVAGYSAEFWDL